MVEGKEGFSRKNLIDLMFILVFAIFIVSMFNFAVADTTFTLNITNETDGVGQQINFTASNCSANTTGCFLYGFVNEDVMYTYNFSFSHLASNSTRLNLTRINISLPAGFRYIPRSNKTGNFSTSLYFNYTNETTTTQYTFTWNTIGDVNARAILNHSARGNPVFLMFNATAPDPGTYNITIRYIYNDSMGMADTEFNQTYINIIVNDTTAPSNITLSDTNLLNNSKVGFAVGNFSGNLLLNISTGDNSGAIRSVFFNITANNTREGNGTGWFYQATNASTSPNWWTYTLNTHNLPDGFYNITVWVNDSNGNLNMTRSVNITVDNTAPTGTMECSPIDAYVGGIVTCTCASTDNLAGITSAGNTYTASPSTSSSGTEITQTCTFTDTAGNAGSAISNAYNVWGTTVDGNGGSGGSSTTTKPVTATTSFGEITPSNPVTMTNFVSDSGVKEIKVEVSQAASGVKLTVNKYESAPSAVSSKSGTYKYLNIETQNLGTKLSKATIKIQVEKSWVSNKGITKEDIALFKYDETGKKWNELTTIFNSEDATYYYYTVELSSFSYFAIAAKEGVTVEEEEEETTTPAGGETSKPTGLGPYWIWIIVGAIALAIIIGLGIKLKKKK